MRNLLTAVLLCSVVAPLRSMPKDPSDLQDLGGIQSAVQEQSAADKKAMAAAGPAEITQSVDFMYQEYCENYIAGLPELNSDTVYFLGSCQSVGTLFNGRFTATVKVKAIGPPPLKARTLRYTYGGWLEPRDDIMAICNQKERILSQYNTEHLVLVTHCIDDGNKSILLETTVKLLN